MKFGIHEQYQPHMFEIWVTFLWNYVLLGIYICCGGYICIYKGCSRSFEISGNFWKYHMKQPQVDPGNLQNVLRLWSVRTFPRLCPVSNTFSFVYSCVYMYYTLHGYTVDTSLQFWNHTLVQKKMRFFLTSEQEIVVRVGGRVWRVKSLGITLIFNISRNSKTTEVLWARWLSWRLYI